MNLFDQLKAAREHAGLTQAEVAKRMKTYKANISEIEQGKTNPTLNTLNKYCAAVGATLEIKITFN